MSVTVSGLPRLEVSNPSQPIGSPAHGSIKSRIRSELGQPTTNNLFILSGTWFWVMKAAHFTWVSLFWNWPTCLSYFG